LLRRGALPRVAQGDPPEPRAVEDKPEEVTNWTRNDSVMRRKAAVGVRYGFALSEIRAAIDARFREEGIEIPFPQRDLHLRSVDDEAFGALLEKRRKGS